MPFWMRYLAITFVLVVGWFFILWQNRFHITAPVVFVCLGFLAAVFVIVNLWRTGATVAEDDDDAAWTRPLGAHDELEKEKKSLLKAIKEAEFDREMGKLSAADADSLIKSYRARAIDVIKALEGYENESASIREKIEKEVKARLEVAQAAKPAKKSKKAKQEAAS